MRTISLKVPALPWSHYEVNGFAPRTGSTISGDRSCIAGLGGCELCPLGNGAANLSYWTYPRYRGRGVASRAVTLAREVALAEFDFSGLQIVTDPDNIPSRKIAARNGFEEVGEQDGRILYTLEARDRE